MKKVIEQIRWRYLLGIFKIKRLAQGLLSTRRLDFEEKNILISTSTLREYHTRARSCAKEPETCSWLREVAKPGAVVYDIGANIGAYSLIAGSQGAQVIAFEPVPENYATLNRNILLNSLESYITSLSLVLGSENKTQQFLISDKTSGATAGMVSSEKNEHGSFLPVITLDECVRLFNLPSPSAIKIDVDGGEGDVLRGATRTLRLPSLASLLVEVDDSLRAEIDRVILSAGFMIHDVFERETGIYNVLYKKQ